MERQREKWGGTVQAGAREKKERGESKARANEGKKENKGIQESKGAAWIRGCRRKIYQYINQM